MAETTPLLTRQRYDSFTLALHWVTAACVIFLFASAHIWEQLERGTPLRKALQAVHISCGILLAVVMVIRPLWRLFSRYSAQFSVPPIEGARLAKLLAHGMHGALYLLLFAQIVLGFLFRWSQQEPFLFFGLFDLSGWVQITPTLRHTLAQWHGTVAWALVFLALVHALAALFHHYMLRDSVLSRMLPGRAFR
ncbi:cytochrome b561 [Kosakonia arachidis]|uniref:Cytochrome b561 n=1 Tax=Kosakonia arachidis TaxID=551989 RepID=A0A1I7DVL3_9ENTR|nr:cytochrome b [Kosakonia arachidis]SFU15666.1 cytochrome b561 [Kosakonia arachidis]